MDHTHGSANNGGNGTKDELRERRRDMVDLQIASRGIRDPAVLWAMTEVRRDCFLPDYLRRFAYEDTALPIGEGQTISQPYIVALMASALELERTSRVLDVGSGSGYAAAVFSLLARQVCCIERHAALATKAAATLRELGYKNVDVRVGDGTKGWPLGGRFDAIAVAASGSSVPKPLREQLSVGGRMVIPVGGVQQPQRLLRIVRLDNDVFEEKELLHVRFVPLVGDPEQTQQGTEAHSSDFS